MGSKEVNNENKNKDFWAVEIQTQGEIEILPLKLIFAMVIEAR